MGNETRNERNFRILKRRFEIENEIESLIEMYGNTFKAIVVNGNELRLWIVNGNELVPVLENETLFIIRNELPFMVGVGIGNELRNEPNKAFENEIWFRNENGFQFGNENGNGNGNELRNENQSKNELRNELCSGNEQPSANKKPFRNERSLLRKIKEWLF